MSGVVERISREITSQGAIPFARFMELALYYPEHGYYEKAANSVGRGGDYYTSTSVGSLFGELLAAQFAEWTEPGASKVRLVEAGAHRGDLGRDILVWMRDWRPALFERVEYCLVEPSTRRRAWQHQTLGDLAYKARWVDAVSDLPVNGSTEGLHDIVFANELLDAFPVKRLVWDAGLRRWFELGVTFRGGCFDWVRLEGTELGSAPSGVDGRCAMDGTPDPDPRCALPHLPAELASVLPEGFIFDYCPGAAAWWRAAAAVLGDGRLLTLDYGLTAAELLSPERRGGTLRAYFRHQVSGDLLANPGGQDLTTHVDFSAIQAAGEAAGLETEGFESQARFLTRIAAGIWQGRIRFGAWTSKQSRQFMTLTHPEHLGHRFRVLVQRSRPGVRNSR